MSLTKLKEKGQVTIPAAVRAKMNAKLGDVFEVEVAGGNIVLKPREVVARESGRAAPASRAPDIGKWIGAGKGLFKSTKDVDAFIRRERDQWD
jgi:AbrB family looped-hinge helix DNA binding protein